MLEHNSWPVIVAMPPLQALTLAAACGCSAMGWLMRWRAAAALGALTLGLGLAGGVVAWFGAGAIALYVAWVADAAQKCRDGVVEAWLQALACAALALNVVPGFAANLFDAALVIKDQAIGFYPQWHLAGTLAAVASLGTSRALWATAPPRPVAQGALWGALPALCVICALIPLAQVLKLVRLDPSITWMTGLFMLHNLLLVVIPEEVLFRGLLPEVFGRSLPVRWRGPVPLGILCAAIFGLGHGAGGPPLVMLSFVAGLGYAWARHRAQGLGGSVLAHLALNGVHVLFFTYPALSPGAAGAPAAL